MFVLQWDHFLCDAYKILASSTSTHCPTSRMEKLRSKEVKSLALSQSHTDQKNSLPPLSSSHWPTPSTPRVTHHSISVCRAHACVCVYIYTYLYMLFGACIQQCWGYSQHSIQAFSHWFRWWGGGDHEVPGRKLRAPPAGNAGTLIFGRITPVWFTSSNPKGLSRAPGQKELTVSGPFLSCRERGCRNPS